MYGAEKVAIGSRRIRMRNEAMKERGVRGAEGAEPKRRLSCGLAGPADQLDEFLVRAELGQLAGELFHGVDVAGPAEQKLILVRLLQTPPSEILADARLPGQ